MADFSKIRKLCKSKGITLKHLASEIGLTQTGVQNILESNQTRIDTLEKLCNFFEVPPSYFLDVNIKEDEREFLLEKRILELQEMFKQYMDSHNQPQNQP